MLMSALLLVALAAFSFSMLRRLAPLLAMQPEKRWDRLGTRLGQMLLTALGQRRFLQRWEFTHGLAHILIFWGFLVVGINTVHLVGRGFVPGWSLPYFHDTWLGLTYAGAKDLFVALVMLGTLLALFRRVVFKPERMTLSWEANLILLWIFSMMVLDVIYGGALFVMEPANPEQQTAFMGVLARQAFLGLGLGPDDAATRALHEVGLWGHVVLVLGFLNYLPYGKHFHVITSLPNVFFGDLKHRGELAKQDLEREDAIYGVSQLEDFPWKRALDMYTCTECGRCQANCPAHLTGKPLSPKRLVMDERDHLKKKTPLLMKVARLRRKGARDKAQELSASWEGAVLTGGVIEDEVNWSCTTCGHCVENCPVVIEHIDHIVDMRRHLVQVESRFPKELTGVFKGWENMSNPWGLASNSRGEWMEGSGVKTPAENPDFEYLYYVGCAGSFDDRNKKVTRALVHLLQRAGVSFVCLGNDEQCCGETARRIGNEYLAQTMMAANVELWNSLGVKKIITACPHGYNTIKNEYPQFGGRYEVVHHTELLARLVAEGKLKPARPFERPGPLAYHDSCYLGRYNKIYDPPRALARALPGAALVEAERRRQIGFCCGAGGGRMWMEEPPDQRVNLKRAEQLAETGAKTFATACPFCLIMLDDAIKQKGLEDDLKTLDLAELLERSLEKDAGPTPGS
jgi:Fe-S oxidoreductase